MLSRSAMHNHGAIVCNRARPITSRNASSMLCRTTRARVAATEQRLGSPKAASNNQELLDKLNEILGGLTHKTRKATAKAVKVVHVSKAKLDHRKLDNTPRCTGLDMDIAWEAVPHAQAPAEPLQGLARVKLVTGPCDSVSVSDIQVMEQQDAGEEGVPRMPSAEPAPPEVLLAVASMDSVIMEHLNDFMWEMEQSRDFPLASFEIDDDTDEEPYFPADAVTDAANNLPYETTAGQQQQLQEQRFSGGMVLPSPEELLQQGAALLQGNGPAMATA